MQTKKSEGTAGTSETEKKKLTRGEVLQLLRVCWSQLMENGGNKRIEKKEGFLYYSMKLAGTEFTFPKATCRQSASDTKTRKKKTSKTKKRTKTNKKAVKRK